jgi:Leucine-rich repeat (LRR) protein
VKGAFSSQLPNKLPTTNNTASRLQKPLPTNGSTAKGPLFTKPLRKASETKVAEAKDDVEPQKETESEKVPESSLSLRETIAKAKAARRSGVGVTNDASIPRSAEQNALPAATLEVDPATFEVLDSRFTNMLRKRINTARADGRLNIAAMSLTEIPKEVLRMYEFDANDTGNTAWYENVDLTRLNAADNEITELDETVFPDHDPEVPADDDAPVSIFAGLEQLDLHGNQLEEIPLGLRKLSKLMSLNLARNQITIPVFEILGTMQSLKELRLGKNSLQGTIPDGVCSLSNLEILEMQENGVSELPANIHKLSKLKMLNVADNKLTLLPFEQLAALPLVELMASRNRLSGVLISSAVSAMPTLQKLDVSHNALISFTDAEIDLPALRSLGISNNRISSLPDISRWHQLTVLSADENKISEIPQGFTTLLQLKTVDLSNNSLLTIDEKVGLMDNLVAMRIEDNPLRERKLLKMNTEDLKIELRSRFETATRSPATEAHIRPFMLRNTEKPQPTAWPVNSAGVLDRSNTKLRTIESTDVETLSKEHAVRTVIIHHNQLQHIPLPLEIFGTTLVTLDMSHNKLGKNEAYLTSSITLPFLQSLNLTSNGLTTLDPLVNHLSAPALGTLILPFNRLTKLPLLCKTFPALSTLLASNNAITQLDVEAVRGLRVLDVGSNEIEHLPPKLALLQGQLRTLMIGGNKFRVPGWGVLEKGTEEILSWCRKRIPAGEDGSAVDELD